MAVLTYARRTHRRYMGCSWFSRRGPRAVLFYVSFLMVSSPQKMKSVHVFIYEVISSYYNVKAGGTPFHL